MKYFRHRVFLFLILTLLLFLPVQAAGDPNIDGDGGGGTGGGGGGSGSGWNAGDDGVRITVVNEKTGRGVTTPVDFTNATNLSERMHFGKRSKIDYVQRGVNLTRDLSRYTAENPGANFPRVISSNGTSNIAAVKAYFSSQETIAGLCTFFPTPYNDFAILTNGDYVLLIEPIAYLTYEGYAYAMTATEAALYDQVLSGAIKSKMGSLSHQNLPRSMYLELPAMGFPVPTAAMKTASRNSNTDILSCLGLGMVRFKAGPPEPPPVIEGEEIYRTDTEVITSVRVTNTNGKGTHWTEVGPAPWNESIPKGSIEYVDFDIGGAKYSVGFICPPDESQLVWVKWRTPKTAAEVPITVTAPSGFTVDRTHIKAKVEPIYDNLIPHRLIDDSYGSLNSRPAHIKLTRLQSTPDISSNLSATWGIWTVSWYTNMEYQEDLKWVVVGTETGSDDCDCELEDDEWCTSDHSYSYDVYDWVDFGRWVDRGWWNYSWVERKLRMSTELRLVPDKRVPTEVNRGYGRWEIKSAYGVNLNMKIQLVPSGVNANYDVTDPQSGMAFFPEYDYKTYNRVLECSDSSGWNTTWSFKDNPYSQFSNQSVERHKNGPASRVHFTPVWYPDKMNYPVWGVVFDVWTPAGQLWYADDSEDDIYIYGNVYDDWYVRPVMWDEG